MALIYDMMQQEIFLWQKLISSKQLEGLFSTKSLIVISIVILFIMILWNGGIYYKSNLLSRKMIILLTIIFGIIFGKGFEIIFRTLHIIFSGDYGNVGFSLKDIFMSLLFGNGLVYFGYEVFINLLHNLRLQTIEDAQIIIDTQPNEIVDSTVLNEEQQPNEIVDSTVLNEGQQPKEENAKLNETLKKHEKLLDSVSRKLNDLTTKMEIQQTSFMENRKTFMENEALFDSVFGKLEPNERMYDKFEYYFEEKVFPKLNKLNQMLAEQKEKARRDAFEKVGLGEIMLELKSIVSGTQNTRQNPNQIVNELSKIKDYLELKVDINKASEFKTYQFVTYLEKKLRVLNRILNPSNGVNLTEINNRVVNLTEINQIVRKLEEYKAKTVVELEAAEAAK
ncbi:hypothetical protein GINT2_001594 [Glugoides intestinalis]